MRIFDPTMGIGCLPACICARLLQNPGAVCTQGCSHSVPTSDMHASDCTLRFYCGSSTLPSTLNP